VKGYLLAKLYKRQGQKIFAGQAPHPQVNVKRRKYLKLACGFSLSTIFLDMPGRRCYYFPVSFKGG